MSELFTGSAVRTYNPTLGTLTVLLHASSSGIQTRCLPNCSLETDLILSYTETQGRYIYKCDLSNCGHCSTLPLVISVFWVVVSNPVPCVVAIRPCSTNHSSSQSRPEQQRVQRRNGNVVDSHGMAPCSNFQRHTWYYMGVHGFVQSL